MADLSKFQINGVNYDLKDATARKDSGGNVDLGVTGATVGQTVKISAVDENGVPTAWESVDFPSGGGEKMRFLTDVTLTEDTSSIVISEDKDGNPFSLSKVYVRADVVAKAGNAGNMFFAVNGIDIGGSQGFLESSRMYFWKVEINADGTVVAIRAGGLINAVQTTYMSAILPENKAGSSNTGLGDKITKINFRTGTVNHIYGAGMRIVVYGA